MTLPTPPRYVVVPQDIIDQAYGPDKPPRVLLASFVRILSLAWQAKYQHTPPLNEEELMEFLKLSRRQYFDQKADMERMQWLRSSHPKPGFVQFSFSRSVSTIAEHVVASAENFQPSAENRTDELKRIEEEESFNFKDSESSSSSSTTPEVRKTALNDSERKMRLLVDHLHLLFPPGDHGALEWRDIFSVGIPSAVLCWIAKAYQDRKKLDAPLGLIVKHIMLQDEPAGFYALNYHDILPEDYLEAVGLLTIECDHCDQIFSKRDLLRKHLDECHPHRCIECGQDFGTDALLQMHVHQVHEIPTQEMITIGIDSEAQRAWQSVLGQLQMEMPRASFDTWVRDAQAVRYDRNALTVAVRNAYARDWLEDRLRSTVERLLIGILNTRVDVIFVTSDQVQEVE